MNIKKNIIKIIIINIIFIFCAFLQIENTSAIYRNTLNTSVSLTIVDPATNYVVTFKYYNGDDDTERPKKYGDTVGPLSSPTKEGYNFIGWYTTPDTGGTKISTDTVITGPVTFHARYVAIVCKKAASGTLHTETCGTGGGCLKHDYTTTSPDNVITYGTIAGASDPVAGNAYDCDVNADGVFSPTTERFYFIRSINDSLNGGIDKAALVHYTSFDQDGQMDSSIDRLNYEYEPGKAYLPNSTTWPTNDPWDNSALITFDEKTTRYITLDDLAEGCGGEVELNNVSFLSSCQYFLENSRYQSSSLGRAGLWIEKTNNKLYRIQTQTVQVQTPTDSASKNTVRPVIEIPYNAIEGYRERAAYNIYFDSDGGTFASNGSSILTKTLYEGQQLGSLESPTKTNYVFDGWYTDNSWTTEVTSSMVVTGSVTYIAKWSEIPDNLRTVFYIPGKCTFTASGQNTDITSSTNDCISTINPTGSPIDYTATSNRYIDTGVSLYSSANHDKDYEISFEIEDYDYSVQVAQATLMNTKNEATGYPGVVFRKDNNVATKFELASRRTSGGNAIETFVASTVTKVSIFRTNGEIHYSINDGEKIFLNNLSQYNPVFNLPVWFGAAPADANATTAQRYLTGTLKNMRIKISPDDHSVTFNGEGGTVSISPNTMTVNHGSSIGAANLPTASKPGKYFDGWYTAASGGTKITGEEIITTDGIEYHAQYKDIYIITFNTDGGTIAYSPSTTETVSGNTMEVADGNTISVLPSATKIGFALDGWYTAPNGGGTKYQGNEIISADATYYAYWVVVSDYSITFESNGGSAVPGMTVPAGSPLGSLPADPIRNDYTFDGWYEDDVTFLIPVTVNTVPTGTTTYFAKWLLDSSYVAQIGSTYYTSLSSAFDAITDNTPTTIIILQDIPMTTKITIPANRDITLNIGNHVISNSSQNVFENNGTLRIHDGTIRDTANQGAINNNGGANLYVSGGIIENTSNRQGIYNKGNLYISGDAIIRTSAVQRGAIDNDDANAVIEISGGTIQSTSSSSKTGALRIVSGTVRVTGGTIISASTATAVSEKGDYAAAIYNKGNLTIGTQDGSHSTSAPIIQAKRYGVYSTVNYSFYDGILKGVTGAVNDETLITATESGTQKVNDTEVISGSTYNRLYYEAPNGYQITLNANGGSGIPAYVTITQGSAINNSLPTPSKTNCYFGGWYEDDVTFAIPVTSATVPSGDTTYHAKWIDTVLLANITNDEIDLLVNGTETINVTNTSSIEAYTYSSLNPSIASVNSSGVVTANAIGVAKIALTGNLSSEVKYVTVRVNIANDIETFDIIPDAMRTYFNNISTWAAGQTDSNHSSYDTYMSNNLSNYNCIDFDGDNRLSATGSVYCDLPNHYDTGVNGNVNVYEYDYVNDTTSSASYVTVNNGELYNFIPGKAYYWESASDSSVNGKLYAYGERRIIQIDNLKSGSSDTYFQTRNVRDLGGIPVTYQDSGNVTRTGTIKYGKLFRGEKIWGGAGNSLQYFTKLGINHEMDLRADSEPVSGEEDSFAAASKIIKSGSSKTYEIIHYGIDYNNDYMANYTLARNALIEIMNAFTDVNNTDYSLYFHCRIGADRTGTIAYLLEGLLGVSEEDRYRDYEMSVFFGLDERTRFYTNKTTNYVKFVHMKKAIRDAGDGVNEDVVAWFLAGSTNQQADMDLIQSFRSAMIDIN